MKTRWLILLCLVGVIMIAAPEPNDTVACAAFQEGVEPEAPSTREGALRRAITRRPLDPQPWRALGDLYAAWGRPYEAFDAYSEARLRNDVSASRKRGLAQMYASVGDLRRSAEDWSDYLARHPNDDAARLGLVRTLIRLADWERARGELEHMLADDPNAPLVHAWLGLLLIGPDPVRGTSHLQLASVDPVLARLLASVSDVALLSEATNDPSYRSALLGVSLLDLDALDSGWRLESGSSEIGRVVEEELDQTFATLALRSLLAAVYINPSYADAYAYLGRALDQLGLPSWASAALRRAAELAPNSPVVQTMTGLYWDRHGEPDLARHHFEAAYRQDQDGVVLALEIAATYAAQGEYTAAEVWLHLARQAAPDDPKVWKSLAHYYLDWGIGVESAGISAARRLVELAPSDAEAHDLMGWAHLLVGENALAEESLNQALQLNATLASANYHLGRLQARQGRFAEAAINYRRAADYDTEGKFTTQLERALEELPPAISDEP